MFNLVVNACNQYIKDLYNQFGLNFEVVYSSDLDDLKQYTNNFNFRAIFRNDTSIDMLERLKTKFSNTKDYAVLLYNYEPPVLDKSSFNQMDLKVYFKDDVNDAKLEKVKTQVNRLADGEEFLRALKATNNTGENAYPVRDLKVVNMKLNFKLISPNQEFIDNFTILYLTELQRNRAIEVSIDFGGSVGKQSMEMFPVFDDIESWGLIDTTRAADLRQVGFSVTLTAPIFSNFTEVILGIKEIIITLGVGDIKSNSK